MTESTPSTTALPEALKPQLYKGRAKYIIEGLMRAGHSRKEARMILTNAMTESNRKQAGKLTTGGSPDAHQLSRQVARRQAMGRVNVPGAANRITETKSLHKARTSPVYKHPSLKLS